MQREWLPGADCDSVIAVSFLVIRRIEPTLRVDGPAWLARSRSATSDGAQPGGRGREPVAHRNDTFVTGSRGGVSPQFLHELRTPIVETRP